MNRRPHGRPASSLALLVVALLLTGPPGARPGDLRRYEVDVGSSRLWVVTHRSGLLSFLGHEHAIVPGEWEAALCAAYPVPPGAHGEIRIRTGSLTVDSDSARSLAGLGDGPDGDDVREVRGRMLDADHLAADRFPEIVLALHAREGGAGGQTEVEGAITVRGITRDVELPVTVERGASGALRLVGTLRIRQSDFGIEPESVAGVVKVSDEVDLHFRLVALPTDRPCGGPPAPAGRDAA